ncbi:L-glutamate gamma-semialdehyde dehydrogenase [Thermodesulforhabdus norvegica]|uniref:L-glutamate gamma-semialdehyde dehydrogenase n=1 Tax=Thermodesulforhabdus norvegica TaxID=39841 RepID=A0A1I4UXD7_9BACT|nr:L-glutamate gamma-semialdehyde dehydrogenase [Thermodesulforhabdus norvegica]SFM93601.1 L-proline dehydrogenase /delta-1-pyrroline-5-carboxylate dehydrogenase [Thermodesulforhabdus norvegica]
MATALEERIYRTGKWLYELIEGESPSIFKKEYWSGKVIEWCMKDEKFKVQMFRFIDVLPYLTRTESVVQHLNEYFCGPDGSAPPVLQWGIKGMGLMSFTSKFMAQSIAENIKNMGKLFIAAETPQEALPVLEKLRKDGLAFSVDLLGEAVVSEAEAEEYQRRYMELLDTLGEAQKSWTPLGDGSGNLDWGYAPMINVSIKPSAMYSQMRPQAFDYSVDQARERLRPILRKAVSMGAHITLDMEHYELKDMTFALFQRLKEEPEFREYPEFGIVIQSYLKSSEEDCKRILAWAEKNKMRIPIRLVKGAYWDAEVIWARQKNWPIPVFTRKAETDARFEKLAALLLQNHQRVYFACASHNIRSISFVIETAKDLKVPHSAYEFQILFGMAEPVRNALRKAGLPLRLYTPIGEMIPGMAYLIRRLLENTANESFLRLSFSEGKSIDELLKNPLELINTRESKKPAAESEATLPPFKNEPPTDWTVEANRRSFASALREVRKSMPFQAPLIIDGKKIKTEEIIESRNPNSFSEIVGVASKANGSHAQKAVEAAWKAFPSWGDTPPERRAEILIRAAEEARKKRHFLAALQVLEVGKSWSEADADVCEAIDFLEYYAREMIRLSRPRRMGDVPGEISELFYEPRGVALVVAPWNFPLAISTGMTSAALVTGNTVVYKPSSQSAITGYMMVTLFEKAGLPPGVLNYLPGPGRIIGDHLLRHPLVHMIAFTGSKEVGLHIIAQAAQTPPEAQHVKSVIAEMGGKNAIIIDSDADLDEAVVHVLHSAFGYQGQKCSACSRVIVLEENYDRFVTRLKAAAESIEIGPVEDPRFFMGAVIDEGAQKKIMEYIEHGKKDGKVLVMKTPEKGAEGGYFVPLTIFTDLPPDHRLCQEEIFGPVLVVIKARTFDEALDIANGTAFALTGGVFSRSPQNIEKAKKAFRVGNLYINRGITGAIVNRHPFGGFKLSGIGSKAGGPDYLLQFMVPRNNVENTMRRGFAPDIDFSDL